MAPGTGKDTKLADRIKRKPHVSDTIVPETKSSTLSPSISDLYMASLSPTTDGILIYVGKKVTSILPN